MKIHLIIKIIGNILHIKKVTEHFIFAIIKFKHEDNNPNMSILLLTLLAYQDFLQNMFLEVCSKIKKLY